MITDGSHNCGGKDPQVEIDAMTIPGDKIVDVFLLGVGEKFPVQYSVNLRSRLHNGSSTCPTLFWSRLWSNIKEEVSNIAQEVRRGILKLQITPPAKILPLVKERKTVVSAGEYLYYNANPTIARKKIKVTTFNNQILPVNSEIKDADADLLFSKVYKQWNSLLLQRHRNKLTVPMTVLDLMEKAFAVLLEGEQVLSRTNLKLRLQRKATKSLALEFAKMLKQTRKMIESENDYKDEIELAEAILQTTVQTRFEARLLEIRGHGNDDWKRDVKEFRQKYLEMKENIVALPEPHPDECCRILMCSFISDIKDPDFTDLLKENKMDFLANLSVTGIPVHAPVKDSVQINPWTMYIKNICLSPFEVLSQRAMESSAAVMGLRPDSSDKEIQLQEDNPNSVFNAIVPILPKQYCQPLKKLIRTNVFSVASTFCILKNALIVDHNCHIAALGCVWMKTIQDHPIASRPEFIKKRIENIDATAKLYIDRKAISNYISALLKNPNLALMTESSDEFNGTILKCESLVKPCFFLHLAEEKIRTHTSEIDFRKFVQMILIEFLGRCLSSNRSTTPYMDFLVADFPEKRRKEWMERALKVNT